MHSFSGRGWHHSDFSHSGSQILYRLRVNRLLVPNEISLCVAGSGEDRCQDWPSHQFENQTLAMTSVA